LAWRRTFNQAHNYREYSSWYGADGLFVGPDEPSALPASAGVRVQFKLEN
jgi:hypothetical protein